MKRQAEEEDQALGSVRLENRFLFCVFLIKVQEGGGTTDGLTTPGSVAGLGEGAEFPTLWENM